MLLGMAKEQKSPKNSLKSMLSSCSIKEFDAHEGITYIANAINDKLI